VLADHVRTVVGDKTAKALTAGLGIETVGDLLRHYPRRYAERGELTDLASLRLDAEATVIAEVATVETKPMRQRRGKVLQVVVTDGRGRLTLTFFGNTAWHERELRVGRLGMFAGKVGAFRGTRQLTHPVYEMIDDAGELDGADLDAAAAQAAAAFSRAPIPFYRATQQLVSWRIAKAVAAALDTMSDLPDPLPADLRARHGLVPLGEAFELIHRPRVAQDWQRARQRLVFEEAYVLQVELARRRAQAAWLPAVPRVGRPGGVLEAFDSRTPFTLTAGQVEVGEQLAADLARDHPMHRLLQGEVGSGKTVVALRAMLAVVDSGGQSALLAPTEVLAQQHHRSLAALLGPLAERGMLGGADLGTRVVLLTGSTAAAARRRALLDAASGEAGIVVGTHALLEERVAFADLGLVVVDEQHRFGVEQRSALAAKGSTPPHVLVMTATPIPRTIAMTVFGDLDVSTLRELPAGRAPILTHLVPAGELPHYLDRAWARVREEVQAGHQVYVVCPRIGTDDPDGEGGNPGARDSPPRDDGPGQDAFEDDGQDQPRRPAVALLDLAAELAGGPLAGLRLQMLHGRMPADDKDEVMRRFTAGEVDVLVATTVVEVGVDVPNATVMVVMDADRFGVSQLHQLRGRVGRGTAAGLCLLVTYLPEGSPSRDRLDAVSATTDGFELALVDLHNRREGDVLGASQAGRRSSLRLLDVRRDEEVIAAAREEAVALVGDDPDLAAHPALRAAVAAYADEEQSGYLEKA
jgi:ATP-dependent DNA helicase RecG